MKTKKLNKTQLTQDMRKSVSQRLEDRYGKRPDAGFSYQIVDGAVVRV